MPLRRSGFGPWGSVPGALVPSAVSHHEGDAGDDQEATTVRSTMPPASRVAFRWPLLAMNCSNTAHSSSDPGLVEFRSSGRIARPRAEAAINSPSRLNLVSSRFALTIQKLAVRWYHGA